MSHFKRFALSGAFVAASAFGTAAALEPPAFEDPNDCTEVALAPGGVAPHASPRMKAAPRVTRRVEPGGAPSSEAAVDQSIAVAPEPQIAPSPPPPPAAGGIPPRLEADRDKYPDVDPEPVRSVADTPVSTFSVDVDTASYAVVRRFLRDGELPPSDAVRIEEMVNYFDYDYAPPEKDGHPLHPTVVVHPSPWAKGKDIVHIGIEAYDPYGEERPPANLVFLVDVSGSMDEPDRLPLVRHALRLLMKRMTAEDRVAIVTYAGSAGIHLEPTAGDRHETVEAAIRRLCPGGSTAGAEGLKTAYELAARNFDASAVNRVLLATDGDFNVGVTDDERLEDFVARKRKDGIYLTVLGFGRGNYQDQRMQVLAQAGNGNAAYIDGPEEAEKALVDEMASTLLPVADDVKVQIEFNPARVAEYRLIGYETRMLKREDFAEDAVDAGDVGAGHEVTALYEIAAPGSEGLALEPLRYGKGGPAAGKGAAPAGSASDEIAFLRIRYKPVGRQESVLIERPIVEADRRSLVEAGPDIRFAAAVAGFGQMLRREPFVKDLTLGAIEALAKSDGSDPRGLRAGFLELIGRARRLEMN